VRFLRPAGVPGLFPITVPTWDGSRFGKACTSATSGLCSLRKKNELHLMHYSVAIRNRGVEVYLTLNDLNTMGDSCRHVPKRRCSIQ